MPAVASALGARLSGGRTATKRDEKLDAVARERLAAVKQQIADSLKQSRAASRSTPSRIALERFVASRQSPAFQRARRKVSWRRPTGTMLAGDRKMVLTPAERTGAESILGHTVDFLGSSFLEKGALSPRAVCRLAFRKDGQAEARCPPSDPASSGPQAPA